MVSETPCVVVYSSYCMVFILRYHKLFLSSFFFLLFRWCYEKWNIICPRQRVESNTRARSFGESQLSTRELSAFPPRRGNNSWPFDAVRSFLFSIYYMPVILAVNVS